MSLTRLIATVPMCMCALTHGGASYTLVDLGTLGGSLSQAFGISLGGIVSGEATTSAGILRPSLWNENGPVDLGSPPGFITGMANAVNDAGQAAVTGEDSQQTLGAFLYEDGAWTPLGTLPGTAVSQAWDIDSQGRIVGSSLTLGAGNARGFLWENDELIDLGTFNGPTHAFGINNLRQVVGRSHTLEDDGSTPARAFLWEEDEMINLGVLPGDLYEASQAYDVNDAGEVVGSSWYTSIPLFIAADRATLWRNGGKEIIDLGQTPGPTNCLGGLPFYPDNIARAINNRGQIVGHAQCVTSGGDVAAFLWEDGVNHNLNHLIPDDTGWDLLSARDISDDGRIVGFGLNPAGSLRAYMLVPNIEGDLDGDGDVDFKDLLQLLAAWGSNDPDLDGDGVVGFTDLLILLANWS